MQEYAARGAVEPDSCRNFLGVRTRCSYLPPHFAARLAGKIEGSPGVEDIVLHDPEEWDGLLRSVREAKDTYVIVELGAGYGPFVVGGAVAARHRGITDIRLVAVEGDATHVGWIRSHFRDNDLDPSAHRIIHAVVGTYDGVARFPALRDPRAEWGAEAIFDGSSKSAERLPQHYAPSECHEIACVSLAGILAGLPTVDLVHFDIQGSEGEVIPSAIDALNRQVKRIVVGTHGRDIERSLILLMKRHQWALEIARPAAFDPRNLRRLLRKPRLLFIKPGLCRDGTYVWRNPHLP